MKYIFLDFNGTIINDVELCVTLLNQILNKQHKPMVSIEQYKSIFTFPIKKYYELAGVDFTLDSYEDLAKWFIQEYQPKSMKCGLYDGLIETFQYLKAKGYHLVILSASEKKNLYEQCENYKIIPYFDAILGIDNIHAESKVHLALNYLEQEKIGGSQVLFIGDTLHDLEVAEAIGATCMLVSCGHQSIDVLKKGNVKIIESVSSLVKLL